MDIQKWVNQSKTVHAEILLSTVEPVSKWESARLTGLTLSATTFQRDSKTFGTLIEPIFL